MTTVAPQTWQPRARLSGSMADPLSHNIQGYSQAEVEYRMRAGAAQFKPRFELYDPQRNRVLPDVANVFDAEVSWDETRDIKGALNMRMLPDERLRLAPYQWSVKPIFGVGPMRDGGTAEFPMGVFPWIRPKRDVAGVTGKTETWEINLGDQLHLLDIDGPLEQPIEITAGVPLVEYIRWILYLNGYDAYGADGLGIQHSDRVAASGAWFGFMTAAKQSPFWAQEWATEEPQSWREMLEFVHAALGYQRPHYDKHGLYRAHPDRAWTIEGPDVIYDTADDGVMLLPIVEEPQPDRMANRTVAFRGWSNPNDATQSGWFTSYADLDWYMPSHPLAHLNTGHYITRKANPPTLPFASSDWEMYELAVRDLFERLAYFEIVTLQRTGFLAQHEAYQIVGVRVENDPQMSELGQSFSVWPDATRPIPLYRETAWKTNLFTGKGESKLAKLMRDV